VFFSKLISHPSRLDVQLLCLKFQTKLKKFLLNYSICFGGYFLLGHSIHTYNIQHVKGITIKQCESETRAVAIYSLYEETSARKQNFLYGAWMYWWKGQLWQIAGLHSRWQEESRWPVVRFHEGQNKWWWWWCWQLRDADHWNAMSEKWARRD